MRNRFFVILLILGVVVGCTAKQEPIKFGKDICAHCNMVISDEKYGAEIVTKTGKIFKFDSAECMIDYLSENSAAINDSNPQLYVINLARPGDFIPAREAFFLHDKGFHSPMGGNLAVFSNRMLADNNKLSPGAVVMNWEEVVKSRKELKARPSH